MSRWTLVALGIRELLDLGGGSSDATRRPQLLAFKVKVQQLAQCLPRWSNRARYNHHPTTESLPAGMHENISLLNQYNSLRLAAARRGLQAMGPQSLAFYPLCARSRSVLTPSVNLGKNTTGSSPPLTIPPPHDADTLARPSRPAESNTDSASQAQRALYQPSLNMLHMRFPPDEVEYEAYIIRYCDGARDVALLVSSDNERMAKRGEGVVSVPWCSVPSHASR